MLVKYRKLGFSYVKHHSKLFEDQLNNLHFVTIIATTQILIMQQFFVIIHHTYLYIPSRAGLST